MLLPSVFLLSFSCLSLFFFPLSSPFIPVCALCFRLRTRTNKQKTKKEEKKKEEEKNHLEITLLLSSIT